MKKLILLIAFNVFLSYGQKNETISINWKSNVNYLNLDAKFRFPEFDLEYYSVDISSRQIHFKKVLSVTNTTNPSSLIISNIIYEAISDSEIYDLDKNLIPNRVIASLEVARARDDYKGVLKVSPIVKDSNGYKKIVSFTYNFVESYANNTNQNRSHNITNSVLASGNWYRFYVEKSGVYKITKSFLQSLGLNTNIDPRKIKLYGNGGRMLPLNNAINYDNDLIENAIHFEGEDDGVFNDNDYILFYAEGIDTWNSESLTSVNLFSDKSYYYITFSEGDGKRIQSEIQPSGTPNLVFTKFDDIFYYEKDLVNVGKVGRRWFGEQFSINNDQTFTFTIPNLDTSIPVNIYINTASKSFGNSSFKLKINSTELGTLTFPTLVSGSGIEGYESAFNVSYNANSPSLSLTLSYNNGGVPSSNGYLDFIKISSKRNLIGYGKQFVFYNNEEQSNIGVGQYTITNASNITQIWNITDLANVTKYVNNSNASFAFKVNLGIPKKYVAVDLSDTYSPFKESVSMVQNQNLKGTIFNNSQGIFEDIDYLIITPHFLISQAERLADFHRNNSGLSVRVVTLEKIYQEFSSGKQDIAAIRNLIRYVYWNASDSNKRVKYVNLFGDASYDYKNRLYNNTNIVPTFHGFNPFNTTINNISNMSLYSSFMSDDFYGLMDDNEGQMISSFDGIDIAIGRMLVSTTSQAKDMVDKIIDYHDDKSYGKWRNNYVIYSDDADNETDVRLQFDLNAMADNITLAKPFVNVKKIHTDAYVQQVAAGGERYPQAKRDFLDAFDQGALVFNYFGHGNEDFLARERLFEKLDAQNLTNKNKYPLFITITCEFTRFDDPNRFTGGEYMYWNKNGGAIALIATTRQIGVTTGTSMNYRFSQDLFAFGSNQYPTIAEALRLTKINTASDNRRVVFFIGDPALTLAIPKPKVVLTKVNDVAVSQTLPVLQALSLVKISGEIQNENNELITGYNGNLSVQVFDKDINRFTLGNNGVVAPSPSGVTILGNFYSPGEIIKMNFNTIGEAIFRGNASISNGRFEFSFVVPRDIRVPIGHGKISFYAKRNLPSLEDQTGYDRTIKIGGINVDATADSQPPTVQLYMNDESFTSGGITNCSPYLLAILKDENGINTASGIGHDIIAILDGDETNPYVLNEYYETENDDYTRGKVRFPFRDLSPGLHTILFKAWDVYNNLVTAEIQFNAVCSDEGLRIERVLNYPNPFVSYTEFWFNHNMPFEPLDVQVQILTVSGKLVKTINQQVTTNGFLCRDITWDGKDDFGDKIGKGVYVYKLKVKSITTGKSVEKYEKLVIL